jgi:hypothetical protein
MQPIPIPQNITELNRKYSLRTFRNVIDFFAFYNNISLTNDQINGGDESYRSLHDWLFNDYNARIIRDVNESRSWFGEPLVQSSAEALNRDKYLRMDDYISVYERYIKPRIQEIMKMSQALLEQPALKYNDRQLGVFDFNKASLGLIPVYKYYSIENKDFVEGFEVDTYETKGEFKYRLYADNSPVVLVPQILSDDKKLVDKIYNEVYQGENVFELINKYEVRIGGVDAFTSTYKKVWVLKETKKKIKNAIRIFVKIGENSGCRFDNYKWNGYLALGIAEILDMLGYAVNIVGVYSNDDSKNFDGTLEYGSRAIAINLKRFDETIDKPSLLYILSDMTFFRLKVFDVIIKEAQFYNDSIDRRLGRSSDIYDIERIMYKEFGSRDKMWKKNGELNSGTNFLYYFIGDIRNESMLSTKILEVTSDIINKNAQARDLFG